MRKSSLWGLPALFLISALLISATNGSPVPSVPGSAGLATLAEATSAASQDISFSVLLSGLRNDSLESSYFHKLLRDPRLALKNVYEKKGVKHEYQGISLRHVLAMVDGKDSSPPYVFDEALWKKGYQVSLVAKDGYTASFSTADLEPDALMLAVYEDGQPTQPQIIGTGPKNLWVRDLVAIETSLAPLPAASAAESFRLEIEVNGSSRVYSLADLEASRYWLEGKGSYTTSAGTRYTGVYGGAALRAILEETASLSEKDSVTFVAMDGYEMTYPGSRVLDEKDGRWLLAWKLDGEYLPKDPGFVRTIKVGPGDPNIDGHLSVRMVKKVLVRQKDFKDFNLELSGKRSWTLDRSTVQSCVSCHTKTVTFERKGQSAVYTGFPAWLALGYVDDPDYAPHKQDKSVPAYEKALAEAGYPVDFMAADGFTVTLNAKDLDHNDDIILALYKDGQVVPEGEFPLVLVWDKGASRLPEGIKNAKMLMSVKARF